MKLLTDEQLKKLPVELRIKMMKKQAKFKKLKKKKSTDDDFDVDIKSGGLGTNRTFAEREKRYVNKKAQEIIEPEEDIETMLYNDLKKMYFDNFSSAQRTIIGKFLLQFTRQVRKEADETVEEVLKKLNELIDSGSISIGSEYMELVGIGNEEGQMSVERLNELGEEGNWRFAYTIEGADGKTRFVLYRDLVLNLDKKKKKKAVTSAGRK